MADNENLPRQNSEVTADNKFQVPWYNFFRRLSSRVATLENAPIASTSIITGGSNSIEITVQDATTARTLSADDNNVNIEFTSSSAITVTVNANVLDENSITYLTQGSTGQVTVVAGPGVTIDYSDSLKTRTQESMIGLKQIQVNKFELFGDAEPVAPARSALIRSANSVGAPAWVAPTADSQKLKQVSGVLAWATDTASEIVNVPAGNIAATNVQTALNELDTEKAASVHTHVSTDITDFNSASRAQTEAELIAGANITITPASSGATRTLTIAASGGGGVSDGDKGDISVTASGATWTIDNDVVTFAKMQNIATAKLLGRGSGGSGDVEEITLGTNLSFTGTTLNAAGGGGGVSLATVLTVSSMRV